MQVGDLVLWENSGGEYEQGIILEVIEHEATDDLDYMVYFFLDRAASVMSDYSLELAECSK